ncbi:MAG: hypothetical protein Q9193_004488 [Seirophora villosa]
MSLSTHAKTLQSFVRLPPTPPDLLDGLDKDVDNENIQVALHVLRVERDTLSNLHDLYLSDRAAQRSFNLAVNALDRTWSRGGRVIVSGVGKSGKIGKKFVATLNSLAIRSAFLHPTEAMHGDLGMVGPNDTLVILSYSGRTSELQLMLQHVPPDLPLIAVTSCETLSSCPLFAQRPLDNCIILPAPIPCSEIETFGVPAPTSSTTAALALTDALTLAVARRLHSDPQQVFILHHPGGAIGARMAQTGPQLMADISIKVQEIPIVTPRQAHEESTIQDAILTATRSVSGWVRPSPETVISPRQIQRLGRGADPSQLLRLVAPEIAVEEVDWISIEAANSVQEARDWIRRMRQSSRGKAFLKRGTILGTVDAQRCKSGVVEIESILSEDELVD